MEEREETLRRIEGLLQVKITTIFVNKIFAVLYSYTLEKYNMA